MVDQQTYDAKLSALSTLMQIGAMSKNHPLHATLVELSQWVEENTPEEEGEDDGA